MSWTPNSVRAWTTELAVCLVAGAALGVFGPFGSFLNDVLAIRVAYWVGVFLICSVTLGLAIRLLIPRARRAGVPGWASVPALTLALAVPLTVLTRLVATAFWPAIREAVGVVDWYGQTVLVCLVYLTLHWALQRGEARLAVQRTAPVPAGADVLLRLPARLGRDLLCLSMEDHYVRLHTPRGSMLVLMSLAQAMEEVGDLDGLQVHRSWWVARRAVEGVVRDGRNLRLRLEGGIEAPVSRASVARLRAAGWLEA